MAEHKTKVVDSWKAKSWYAVLAPGMFDNKEIGSVVSADEENLINRKIRISLGDLTGSFTQQGAFVSMNFRITEVKGKTAYTKFVGHQLLPGYIKSLVRRRCSLVYQVDNVKTKDGVPIRMKCMAVTAFRTSESTRAAVRKAVSKHVKALASETTFDTLVHDIVNGRFSSKVLSKLKKVSPMRRFVVRKTEVDEGSSA